MTTPKPRLPSPQRQKPQQIASAWSLGIGGWELEFESSTRLLSALLIPPAGSIPDDHARGVCAVRAADAATGMRAGAAQIEAGDRRAVLRPAEQRAHDVQLIERHLAVMDVAAREAVRRLEFGRRDGLRGEYERRQSRRVLCERVEDRMLQRRARV